MQEPARAAAAEDQEVPEQETSKSQDQETNDLKSRNWYLNQDKNNEGS